MGCATAANQLSAHRFISICDVAAPRCYDGSDGGYQDFCPSERRRKQHEERRHLRTEPLLHLYNGKISGWSLDDPQLPTWKVVLSLASHVQVTLNSSVCYVDLGSAV